ncbi:hypothetical protein M409DRAFT_60303 [Zasmidium cellare ATCC 36951]|uniref:Uncharacterized protein n=1 Tax=Zasmidium cellare ATCC 36951 TaxID=1080233 RepID=A0A6A6BZA0_ZASCE|nr:uncharacterized protein M409DRAFT_60303 [Zasmidium cellare ATCC 36951]KAF2160045.1 hypothetical protein M409DRAFT_60303 [Zasmidium cellare ATCC 36951]
MTISQTTSPYGTRSRSVLDGSMDGVVRSSQRHSEPLSEQSDVSHVEEEDCIQVGSASLPNVIKNAADHRMQALQDLRALWHRNVLEGDGGTQSSLDEELASSTDPGTLDALSSHIKTGMGSHCLNHAKQLATSPYNLSIFRLFALFGHDGVKSKWFLQALRDYIPYQPDFAIAFTTFHDQKRERQAGKTKLPGVDRKAEWVLSDITQAAKKMGYKLPQRRGRPAKNKRKDDVSSRPSMSSTQQAGVSSATGPSLPQDGVASNQQLARDSGESQAQATPVNDPPQNSHPAASLHSTSSPPSKSSLHAAASLHPATSLHPNPNRSCLTSPDPPAANNFTPQNLHLPASNNRLPDTNNTGDEQRAGTLPPLHSDDSSSDSTGNTEESDGDNDTDQQIPDPSHLLSFFRNNTPPPSRLETNVRRARHTKSSPAQQPHPDAQIVGSMRDKRKSVSSKGTPSKRQRRPSSIAATLENSWLDVLQPSSLATGITCHALQDGYWWTDSSIAPVTPPGETAKLVKLGNFISVGTFSGPEHSPDETKNPTKCKMRGFASLQISNMAITVFGLADADCDVAEQTMQALIQRPGIQELFQDKNTHTTSRCTFPAPNTTDQSHLFIAVMMGLAMNGCQPTSTPFVGAWEYCIRICVDLCASENLELETEEDITSLFDDQDFEDPPQVEPQDLANSTFEVLQADLQRHKELVRGQIAHITQVADQLQHIRSFLVTVRSRISDQSTYVTRLKAAISSIRDVQNHDPSQPTPDLVITFESRLRDLELTERKTAILEKLAGQMKSDLVVCSEKKQRIRETAKSLFQAKADQYESTAKAMRDRASLLEQEANGMRGMVDLD